MEPSDLVWIDKRIITAMIGDGRLCDSTSIKEGKRLAEFQMSKFCAQNIVLELLDERDNLNRVLLRSSAAESGDVLMSDGEASLSSKSEAHSHPYRRAMEDNFGCYKVGVAGFISRSALKLADISRLCLDIFAELKSEGMGFIDLYGGSGGFSDYSLWRLGKLARKCWIVNRKHKLCPDPHRFKSISLLDPTLSGLETFGSDGAIDGSCLADVEPLISSAQGSDIMYVFGDGVVKPVSAAVRSKESISFKTFLCQCIVALETLSAGGYFICKITDTLGRCTIGTVLILTTLFDRVTCLKPEMSCPAKSERYLVCIGFVGKEKSSESAVHLREVMHRIEQLSDDSTKDIVALVPQKYLMESAFASALIKMNERDSKQEIMFAKYIVRILQSNGSAAAETDLDADEFLARLGLAAA